MQIQPHDDSRLDEKAEFVVESEEAQEMLPKGVSVDNLRDFRSTTGHSMTRADTIREWHPDRSAAQGLDGREREILGALTRHPSALTRHPDLSEPAFDEEQQERIESLLDPSTGDLNGEELSELLQDDSIDDNTKTVTVGEDKWWGERESPRRALYHWPTADAREMLFERLRHHLHGIARKVEEEPRERSIEQHVERLGIKRLFDASPYFSAE